MRKIKESNFVLFLLEEAQADILVAIDYYNSLVSGLGDKFMNDVKKSIIKIESNPFSFGFRHTNFRTANLSIFPYQIHYIIIKEKMQVIIFAVLHGVRNPDFIKKRGPKQ